MEDQGIYCKEGLRDELEDEIWSSSESTTIADDITRCARKSRTFPVKIETRLLKSQKSRHFQIFKFMELIDSEREFGKEKN